MLRERSDGMVEAYDNPMKRGLPHDRVACVSHIVPAPDFRTRPKRFNSRRSPKVLEPSNAESRATGLAGVLGHLVFPSTMGTGAAAAAAYFTSGRFNAARRPCAVCDPNALAVCLTSAEFAAQERLADLPDAASGPERRSEIEASHLNLSIAVARSDVQMSPLAGGAKLRAANRGDLL